MKRSKRVISMLLLLILSSPVLLFGQDIEPEDVDSVFVEYMRSAWNEIRESENSDSLQRVYSDEFYEYYLQYPDTKTGGDAFAQAFMMWGNTGRSHHVPEALATLTDGSELWRMIIMPLGNIYYKSDELEIEAYHKLLDDLSARLTHPLSRSEVYLALLRGSASENYSDEDAIEFARHLVELDAAEFYVNQGLGYLHELESLNIGQAAPDFTATTLRGEEITLSELKGQVVLLEFWATWCGPCLPEIPHLKELQEKYSDNNFTIVGISIDRDEETLASFIEEREINWLQIFQDNSWESEITRLYNVSGIPRMYVISPEGEIAAKDIRGEEMIKEIDRMMNEAAN